MRTLPPVLPLALTLVSALPMTTGLAQAQVDEAGKTGAMLIEKHASSICTIDVVLKLEFMGQTREHRISGRGMLAHGSGLILADIQVVEPNINVEASGKKVDVEVTPEDFKIVLENEEEERGAFLVGKDSKLGFCFLQLKDGLPEEHRSHVVDYGTAKRPAVGEELLFVNRLSKGYDYAPVFRMTRIVGELDKPRKAWILAGSGRTGLPVWNREGELVGCMARIRSSLASEDSNTGQSVILRGGLVAAAVNQAVKQAEELKASQTEGEDQGGGDDSGKGEAGKDGGESGPDK